MGLNVSTAAQSLELCQKLGSFALDWSDWFLWGALAVGAAEIVVTLHLLVWKAKHGDKDEPKPFTGGAAAAFLTALKGVLEALKGLPAWVAIFLAGLALLWMAGQRPDICKPLPAPPPTASNGL